MSNQKHDGWTWCLHCERVSRTEDWDANGCCCPQVDCDGGPLDGWQWTRIREANPSYPKTPEAGKHYPLYGD
jgi:hypothetical protein